MGKKFKLLKNEERYKKISNEKLDLVSIKDGLISLDRSNSLAYICGSRNSGVTNTMNVIINNIIQEQQKGSYELSILDCGINLADNYKDYETSDMCRVRGNLDVRGFQKSIDEIITGNSNGKIKIVVIHDIDILLDSHNINIRENILQKVINLVGAGCYCIIGMNDYYVETLAKEAKYVIALKSSLRLSNQLLKCPKATSIKAGHCMISCDGELIQEKLPLIEPKLIKENLNS